MCSVFETNVCYSEKGSGYDVKRRDSPKTLLWARAQNSSLCSPKNVLGLYAALNRFYLDGRLTMQKKKKVEKKKYKKTEKKERSFPLFDESTFSPPPSSTYREPVQTNTRQKYPLATPVLFPPVLSSRTVFARNNNIIMLRFFSVGTRTYVL